MYRRSFGRAGRGKLGPTSRVPNAPALHSAPPNFLTATWNLGWGMVPETEARGFPRPKDAWRVRTYSIYLTIDTKGQDTRRQTFGHRDHSGLKFL